MSAVINAPTDLTELKGKLKAIWMSGDYDKIARIIAAGGEEFIERLEIKPGARLLDVACGTGNLSIPAARAGAVVTGVDIAPNLLTMARERAQDEGVEVRFDEGDAEALPYADGSFDEVVSMFGAMFAPQPEKVAAEMARVCRRGGRVAMANWTPRGFIGQLFRIISLYVPPPAQMPSPMLWGHESRVRERLRDGFANLRLIRRTLIMEFPMTPVEAVEYFRAWYGPTHRAFAALDEQSRRALRQDLERHWTEHNRATDGTTSIEAEYLEVRATRE